MVDRLFGYLCDDEDDGRTFYGQSCPKCDYETEDTTSKIIGGERLRLTGHCNKCMITWDLYLESHGYSIRS